MGDDAASRSGAGATGLHTTDLTGRLADIGRRLDFETVAQQIVDAVVEVTDFKVATLTVREGDRCRRLATAGLDDGRIGMTTPYDHWSDLLQDEWRRGANSYLIPPEAPAQWADVPDIEASDDPNAWTADHGLVLPLQDYSDEIIGFIAVDEPRSRLLPDDATVDRLEAFAREAQAAFINAHLYAVARREADTMAQLFDVAKAMAHTADLDQVVPRIVQAMENRFDALVISVGRVTDDEIEVRVRRRGNDQLESFRTKVDGATADLHDELMAAGIIVINDLDDRPELMEYMTPGTNALLLAGSRTEDRRAVTLSVSSDRTGAFDAGDASFLGGLLDITTVAMRNADLYEEVRFAAERDALTGLRNRRMFWSTVTAMLERVGPDHPVCLAVVDIDDFKLLNDQYGHDTGDRVLVHVAGRLDAGVRETDAVFRIGGEEFVLVLPGATGEGAVAAIARIRESVKRTRLDLPGVTLSAGVAEATTSDMNADRLFAEADAALYDAKRAGKDRVSLRPHVVDPLDGV